MKTRLDCPCGAQITGSDEDDLVRRVIAHLRAEHPDREYDREQILFMAY
jgi:predicted small metal-binding protein